MILVIHLVFIRPIDATKAQHLPVHGLRCYKTALAYTHILHSLTFNHISATTNHLLNYTRLPRAKAFSLANYYNPWPIFISASFPSSSHLLKEVGGGRKTTHPQHRRRRRRYSFFFGRGLGVKENIHLIQSMYKKYSRILNLCGLG